MKVEDDMGDRRARPRPERPGSLIRRSGGTYYGEFGPAQRRPPEFLSDERLRREICHSLTHHPDLDAAGLQVEVEGGEVTLTGRVVDREASWLAEELTESVAGVSMVHNRLRAVG
jgi:hypothetical protein